MQHWLRSVLCSVQRLQRYQHRGSDCLCVALVAMLQVQRTEEGRHAFEVL